MKKNSPNKQMVRISHQDLIAKLKSLDEKLVNIWLTEENKLTDEEIWEIFVVLLESRVEILKTCRDAGVRLTSEMCMPSWLERIVTRKKELRLRDIKILADELRRQQRVSKFDAHVISNERTEV